MFPSLARQLRLGSLLLLMTGGLHAQPPSSSLSPIEARELDLILNDLSNASGDSRKRVQDELLQKTDVLIQTHSDLVNLWAIRGVVALERGLGSVARQCAANLLRLHADQNPNDQMLDLLAGLKRKGWLLNEAEAAQASLAEEKQAKDQKEKEQAAAIAQKKARSAKIAKLRQELQECEQQEAAWDAVTSKDRHLRNPTYENYSVDKSYEWGMKAAEIMGQIANLEKGN